MFVLTFTKTNIYYVTMTFVTSEEENLDLLLSLFAESEGQGPQAADGEGDDNLDDLFDGDDDNDEDGYVEPEEEVAPEESSSPGGNSELNKSKDDLEGRRFGFWRNLF